MIACENKFLRAGFAKLTFCGVAAIACLGVACLTNSSAAFGGTPSRMIEISDDTNTFHGKLVARNSDQCFLIDTFGELKQVPVSRMKSFSVLGQNFRPADPGEFRERLQKEFKGGYEVQQTTHFVVVGKRGRARTYASLFEEIYRQVESFYSIRGFRTSPPDSLLVAVVFGSQQEFKEYCQRDQVLWSNELRGYYSLKTNRVALYDHPALPGAVSTTVRPGVSARGTLSNTGFLREDVPAEFLAAVQSTMGGETANTIVHETTHQVGFNIGVHSRIAETPTWIVEGLATVMEAPGIRSRKKSTQSEKVNRERHGWFFSEYMVRHQHGDLAKMIASDDFFRNQTLDAYSIAWAFSYFLTENPARSQLFTKYLRLVGERPAFQSYTPEERLRDFQSVFGDIARVEVDFLRTMDRLESQ